jgi:hypothetical protein
MSISNALPKHLRPRREKVFGDGRPRPMERNAKARVMAYARPFTRRTEKGKHYGQLGVSTRKCTLCPFHENKRGIQRAFQSG